MSSRDINSTTCVIKQFAEKNESNLDIKAVSDAFRYLRNLCGKNPEAQNEIVQDLKILSSTQKILSDVLITQDANQEQILCLRIGLQFLGNLIVGNKNNQQRLWFTSQSFLEACLKFKDTKVQNFSAMILYNIFLGNPEVLNELKHPFEDLYELTLCESTSEFAVFALEVFVLKSNYVEKFYDAVKPEYKLILLEVVINLINAEDNQNIQAETVQFFCKQYIKKSDLILKTSESHANSLDPVEVVKLLDLLVAFSSDDKHSYLGILQQQKSLLINCIELLKNVHSVSKQNENNFSMITKISEINDNEKMNSVQENPVFGFKCSLIRLIGNFCWQNTDNQNRVRELECIPVILDCCNIDARNPFIIQWCVLAIRNLCEKNFQNQRVIASLSKEGKVDSARLQELGITLNVGDGGNPLCIAPLK